MRNEKVEETIIVVCDWIHDTLKSTNMTKMEMVPEMLKGLGTLTGPATMSKKELEEALDAIPRMVDGLSGKLGQFDRDAARGILDTDLRVAFVANNWSIAFGVLLYGLEAGIISKKEYVYLCKAIRCLE